VFVALQDFAKVIFEFSDNGIEIRSTADDYPVSVVVSLQMSADTGSSCDGTASFPITSQKFKEYLVDFYRIDSLKLVDEDVTFKCATTSGRREEIHVPFMPMEIESENMESPNQESKITTVLPPIQMPRVKFEEIYGDLKDFGETMQIRATQEGITFSVDGNSGKSVTLKPSVNPVNKPVTAIDLDMDHLAIIVKATIAKAAQDFAEVVDLGMERPGCPLEVTYYLKEDGGYMRFCLHGAHRHVSGPR